ncbi:MAG TPA: DinB family protein [Planctomycetota bacterium]|nr:DinB family protein [Planctomycetota bacterium]
MPKTPARQEVDDPKAYQKRMKSLLEGREPLEVLAATPDALSAAIRGKSAAELKRQPAPGKWSATQILGHLLDVEWVYGYRMRTILGDERPKIVSMDQDLWVAAQEHRDADAKELAASHAAMRRVNLAFWRRIPKKAYDRVGLHDERGEESIGTLFWMLAGHDLNHLAQIRKVLGQ